MPIANDQIYHRQDRLVQRQIAGETLLVPIRDDVADMSYIFALNSVAAHIWESLDGSESVANIVASVGANFEVDHVQAELDTFSFLEELLSSDLIERVENE